MVTVYMANRDSAKSLECRCTRCKYNNNGTCGYQGRLLINSNGECEMMETGFGGDKGPYGD
ncbi:hypothetical protein GCM10009000_083230 [Halobacterium noricense]|uniref:Uncharacterized protein n=1 Tax=Haladaptatus pallidirubidus TaxID=1008152 RepID=A0AAV3UQZ6_9EURY